MIKEQFLSGFGRFYRAEPMVRTIGEVIFATLLALLLARLIWLVLAPAAATAELIPRPLPAMLASQVGSTSIVSDRTLLVRLNPFSVDVAEEIIPDAPETSLNLKLVGFFMTIDSAEGSAIIVTPDGRTNSFSPGAEIITGVRLERISSDRVLISRNGVSETLMLNGRTDGLSVIGDGSQVAPIAGSSSSVETAPSSEDVDSGADSEGRISDSAAFMQAISVSPVERDGRVSGYQLSARGSEAVLTDAGLQTGDVLLGVNGTSIEGTSISELIRQMGDAQSAILLIERNGETQTLRLQFDE